MIFRQLRLQSTISGTLLKNSMGKYQINRHSARQKSFFQRYNQFWKMFDDKKIEPPYQHCVQIGDPVLRQRAPEVPAEKINSDEIKKLVDKMKTVLRDYNLVGLAAPQIGVSYRIFVMEASEQLKEKYPKAVYDSRQMSILPMTTFINPVLKVKNFNIKMFPEGCASVCGYVGDVGRYEEVLLSGFNEKGDAIEMHLKGWSARIAQHVLDHLNGQIFVDIMEKKSFCCATWEAVNFHGGQLHIPFYPPKKLIKKSIVT